jgi:isopenicillin-N N-acyltransferase like protein
MNEKGLTITINAGTLGMAYHSATPVTLVAREILQYASNIEKAIEIASKRNLFVSESFLVSSAVDKKAVIIEKRPDGEDIVWPDSSVVICTNHYQGTKYALSAANLENKSDNATGYRFLRLQQLLNQNGPMDPLIAASILRNKEGMNGISIGYGNEKALNQLIAHHSIIFEPEKLLMWVSTAPNVMGPYLAYDLKRIFAKNISPDIHVDIDERKFEIPADTFLQTIEYRKYKQFISLSEEIKKDTQEKLFLPDSIADLYKTLNPEYFETYLNLGDYFYSVKNYAGAHELYKTGLGKVTNNLNAHNEILKKYKICDQKIQP